MNAHEPGAGHGTERSADGPANDVHELDHHLGDYRRIIIVLSVATIVEFGISFLITGGQLPLFAGILVLVGIAFFKAVLVAKFFMHLRYDPRILGMIAVTPLAMASIINLICCFDAIKGPAI